jgi:hypothetical protein
VEELLLELLHRLESLDDAYPELGDSEVRHAMGHAVIDGFIRPKPGYVLPATFGLRRPGGDQRVREVLAWFLPAANQCAQQCGLTTFHQRLAAFQNGAVRTARTYDTEDYFGWLEPSSYDETGQVRR